MNRVIDGKGWFVWTISGLASADPKFIKDPGRMLSITDIATILRTLDHAEFSRFSRRGGWRTAEHPVLGVIQWKSGVDFRTVLPYFLLRVNGEEIIHAWPDTSRSTTATFPTWMKCPEGTSFFGVVSQLGYLNK